MKILHVVAAMDPRQGGVSQAVRSIITGLQWQGIENEVASMDGSEASFLVNPGNLLLIHALGPGKGPWCYNAGLYPWLGSNLHRFDAVIVHGLWLYPGYAVKKALRQIVRRKCSEHPKKQSPPKFFVMPHGMLDPYFQQAASRRLKAWRNQLYWTVIEKKIINGANALLFTCEEERRLAGGTFPAYQPKTEYVVGLGVEAPPIYSSEMSNAFALKCPQLNNAPYILFLSRIHEKKGLNLLLAAYSKMMKNMNAVSGRTYELPFPKLVIAGPGLETDYGRQIQEQVKADAELAKNVLFTGMLEGNAKWGAFYGCEAFILPSFQENFGIAVVEAMACSKPVLISNCVNIWQEIETMNSGIIADQSSDGIYKLLESWIKLSEDNQLKMGENARKLFEKSFAVKAASKMLAAALQQ